jgi:hypothetical protein
VIMQDRAKGEPPARRYPLIRSGRV